MRSKKPPIDDVPPSGVRARPERPAGTWFTLSLRNVTRQAAEEERSEEGMRSVTDDDPPPDTERSPRGCG